jgi:threonine aldolase
MSLSCTRTFASDNWSGVHPDIFAALAEANNLHAPAYGNDSYTEHAVKLLKQEFGGEISAHFVLTGTAANVIAVATLLQPGENVICAETAHVYMREDGAHENFSGARFYLVPTKDGKLTSDAIRARLDQEDAKRGNIRLLVITNSTEFGTNYTPTEIKALVEFAHKQGMLVYLDGARLANAAAALNLSLADLTTKCGVDAFSLGGTKNGMLCGEAIIFRESQRFENRAHVFRNFGLQNASKLRFVTAQYRAYLTNALWRKIALQSNKAAAILANEFKERGIALAQKQEANQVWVFFPSALAQLIHEHHYGHLHNGGYVRFVTSWDTESHDIQDFMAWLDKQSTQKVVA